MKNCLVISDPPAAPGFLPRLRYLCNYLVHRGYGVTLLTEAYQPLPFAHAYPIEQITMYSGSTFDWFVKSVWTLLTDWHNRAFAKKFLTAKRSNSVSGLTSNSEAAYDCVICTTFNEFPLGAAQRIAKHLRVPLICDIRDLDEQVDHSRYQYHHQSMLLMPFRHIYRAIHIRRRNAVLRAANVVTTVSEWHADFIRQFNKNVHVVYNGFDPATFFPEDVKSDVFRISYIGSLAEWQKKGLTKVKIAIEQANLKSKTVKIIMDEHTPQENPIPFEQMGEAIRRSSMMLVLTDTRTHGMLTTKFYEALGCEKPVLCVPSDKGELARLIEYTHAGIATNDKQVMQDFIEEKYREWKSRGYTRQETAHREDFSRETQCQRFEEILNTILS